MRKRGLVSQAAVLAAANVLTRGLGFFLRAILSRMLGAEAVGVMALAQSVQMFLIAPVTSGLPTVVSRLTARGENALEAGEKLARRAGLVVLLVFLPLAPVISRLLPDSRALPSLVAYAPCALILGLSCVHNGFCHARGNAVLPAASELTEQALRFALSAGLLMWLPRLTVAGRAAVPALSTVVAELAGMLLVSVLMKKEARAFTASAKPVTCAALAKLSLPLCGLRLTATGTRAAQGALIPAMLMRAGATAGEAASAFGLLAGMAMPVLFLPGMVTGAISVVSVPALAAREEDTRAARALTLRSLSASLLAGGAGALVIWLLSDVIANALYGQAALSPILRLLAPGALLLALQQTAFALLSGLGKQKKALVASLISAAVTLSLTHLWGADILGAARAMLTGQAAGALMGLLLLCGSLQN